MEQETIHGFDIPKRELTQEEKTRDITLKRISNFHIEVGEDLMDQCGSLINHLILTGFLMAKHPELAPNFLEVANNKYGECLGLLSVFQDEDIDNGDDKFYTLLAEFLNLTVAAKARINQILIQVAEHYQDNTLPSNEQ